MRKLLLGDENFYLDKYIYGYGETCCDNCGKKIYNVAIIHDEREIEYKIGLDCAKLLKSISSNELTTISKKINVFNKWLSSIRKSNKQILEEHIIFNKKFVYVVLGDYDNKPMLFYDSNNNVEIYDTRYISDMLPIDILAELNIDIDKLKKIINK